MPLPKISRATRIWNRLKSWWGVRLAEQYGDQPPDDWKKVFDGTDDERLERALTAIRTQSPIHPPTLGQLEAAIPKRDLGGRRQSLSERLCEFAIQRLGRVLCVHQCRGPWNYFGSHFLMGEVPDLRGVQIPECEPCQRQSHRVMVAEMVSDGALVA